VPRCPAESFLCTATSSPSLRMRAGIGTLKIRTFRLPGASSDRFPASVSRPWPSWVSGAGKERSFRVFLFVTVVVTFVRRSLTKV
jgi:hypothetical protein